MAFRQLYYTSCEHGIGGYAGFQFNAVTPGVGPRVMRDIEQLTVYELPSWDSSAADAPVNLCYSPDAERGAITASVAYAGADFSGRAGNYFAHALVTEQPGTDFGPLLPIELWESPMWTTRTADGTSLPTLAGPPARGSLDRPVVATFLSTQDDATSALALLLTAADKAISGGRPLVLWSATSADNARWIAAVSYLLGPARAREMSFFTYTRRPVQARAHVIGTVPGATSSPTTLADGFRVFDMTSGSRPDLPVHPLADLLARVGVVRAAGLWRQAAALSSGDERSFDDWYPAVLAAALMRGIGPLPTAAIGAVADWLPTTAGRPEPLPAAHVAAVLRVLLDRDYELTDQQVRALLPTARASGAEEQLQLLETGLVHRVMPALERGLPPSGPTPLGTAEGQRVGVAACERLLGASPALTILTALDWARETGLQPDPRLVERRARDVVGPALPLNGDRRLAAVGRAFPAFAAGLAAYLVAAGPATAVPLLRGVTGELLDRSDLGRHPGLREMLLTEEVLAGRLAPVDALREVIELRPPSDPPWHDEKLLARLWPHGLRSQSEAAELLWLFEGDIRRSPALALLDAALLPPVHLGDLVPWLDLCEQALASPVGSQLRPATQARLRTLDGLSGLLANAREGARDGDMGWYGFVHARIEKLPAELRDLPRQYLGRLTLTSPRPAEQLGTCSPPVFDATCTQARMRLSAEPYEHALAARLFQALYELRGDQARAAKIRDQVLAPTVLFWPRGVQARVTSRLEQEGRQSVLGKLVSPRRHGRREEDRPDVAEDFRRWCKDNAVAGSGLGLASGRAVASWVSERLRRGAD